ncbi:MAG: DUF5985 family protein [Bdellovibrionota bacterium]
MIEFLSGAIMMGFTIAGLFFLRFYVRTRDSLFAIFAIAFALLSIERWMLFLTHYRQDESNAMIYLIRAFAFLLITFGVVQKNRGKARVSAN